MHSQMTTPLNRAQLKQLRAGDTVSLSGTLYTARDAAHARFFELMQAGGPLPFELKDACIYYAGPTPAPPGLPIGSVGPTTAGRMDRYAPALYAAGLAATIGKGARSAEVLAALKAHGAVYFGFTGGAGALAAACVQKSELLAFEELGSEAVRRLTVKDFPLTVLADCTGGDLYQSGPRQYLDFAEKQIR